MNFEFIQATKEDRDYLLQLRKLTMVAHFEKSGLFLTDAEHAFRLDDDYDCSHLIIINNEKIGTLKCKVCEDKLEIMQIQIDPDFQGQGLGRQVMEQVLKESTSKLVELSVLKENPAINLYKRLGFTITGEDEYEYFMQIKL